jgi:hypothetical protein
VENLLGGCSVFLSAANLSPNKKPTCQISLAVGSLKVLAF